MDLAAYCENPTAGQHLDPDQHRPDRRFEPEERVQRLDHQISAEIADQNPFVREEGLELRTNRQFGLDGIAAEMSVEVN
ncbi:MAG: hypothetical protein O9293_07265 [Porphyrobacter sp.]|nr:hypothetical protein [Porphyrobacter sp.]